MTGDIEEVEGQDDRAPAADMLQQFVSRIERLSDEIAGIQADRRDVFAEAKANGFDAKALREVLRRRKMEPHQLAELDCMVEVYEEAVRGMPRGTYWGGELKAQPAPAIAPPKPNRKKTLALAALAAAEATARAQGA